MATGWFRLLIFNFLGLTKEEPFVFYWRELKMEGVEMVNAFYLLKTKTYGLQFGQMVAFVVAVG